MRISLGTGNPGARRPDTIWEPEALTADGGYLAFDGGTVEVPGSFALDFTDILPHSEVERRYFLGMYNVDRSNDLTLYDYKIINIGYGEEVVSTNVPQVNSKFNSTLYNFVDYI